MSGVAIAGDPWAVGLLLLCAGVVVLAFGLVVVDELRFRRGRRRVARGEVVRFTGRPARKALRRELGRHERERERARR